MKKLLVILFVVIVVAGIVWFVTTTRKGEGEHLVVTGSATLAPLIKKIATRFEARHPDVRIDVQGGGSGRGLDDVREGLTDIGMVSGRAGNGADGLHWFAVAKDGVAFIVHRDNSVGGLSQRQIRDIYTGEITGWRSLGGPDMTITAVSWEEGRGPLNAFLDYTGLANTAIKAGVIADQNERVTSTVARQPGAVGYIPLSAALQAMGRGAPLRLVKLDGVDARPEIIGNGSYPMIITHSLVTRAPPQGLAKRLIDFARSDRNADLIKALDLVPPAR